MINLKIVKGKGKVKRHNETLLVTGDGSYLEDDLRAFLKWQLPHDAMCIGRSIKRYPNRVTHYADVDSDAGKWVLQNLEKNNPKKGRPLKHTLGVVEWCDVCWDSDDLEIEPEDVRWHGSTSLFAALIGLEMGYACICLAGCPLDKEGHWYFPEIKNEPNWAYSDLAIWIEFKKNQRSLRVKSFSGYTKEILGEPSVEWAQWLLATRHIKNRRVA